MITINQPGDQDFAVKIIKAIVGPTEDKFCLDLMAGEGNVMRHIPWRKSVHVDVDDYREKYEPEKNQLFQQTQWNGALIQERPDVITCLDGIEHIQKPQGRQMIHETPLLAETVIFFTPLDPYVIEPKSILPGAHKCLWTPDELGSEWKTLVMPKYHPTLNIGAWFFWVGGASEEEVKGRLGI